MGHVCLLHNQKMGKRRKRPAAQTKIRQVEKTMGPERGKGTKPVTTLKGGNGESSFPKANRQLLLPKTKNRSETERPPSAKEGTQRKENLG